MNPDLVVEVLIRNGDGEGEAATGYVISSDRILTTGHLGPDKSQIKVGAEVNVRFVASKPGEQVPEKKATVEWSSVEPYDCAVLSCEHVPTHVGCLPAVRIRREPLRQVLPWVAHCWCNALASDPDDRDVTPIGGSTHAMPSDAERLQLTCPNPPTGKDSWAGGSGAAVFVQDELVGVVHRLPPNFDGERLFATPICRLLDDESFREKSGLSPCEEESFSTFRDRVQAKVVAQLKGLLSNPSIKDKLCDATKANAGLQTESLADEVAKKLVERPELLFQLEEVRSDAGAQADAVASLQDMLLSVWLDPGVRRRLYRMVSEQQTTVVEGAAATPVTAEIAAAGHYGRKSEFRFDEERQDACGKDDVGLAEASLVEHTPFLQSLAFLRRLASRMLGFKPPRPAAVALQEVQSGQVSSSPDLAKELKTYKSRFALAFETRMQVKSTRLPYCVLQLPDSSEEREDLLAVIDEIKRVVPWLLFIALSSDEALMEKDLPVAQVIKLRFEQ